MDAEWKRIFLKSLAVNGAAAFLILFGIILYDNDPWAEVILLLIIGVGFVVANIVASMIISSDKKPGIASLLAGLLIGVIGSGIFYSLRYLLF